jgi:hypothetical protein
MAHWGLPDPAAVDGTQAEIAAAFQATYDALVQRITSLLAGHPTADTIGDLARQLASREAA